MSDFTCEYCNKQFKRESTVESHKCEKRDRWLIQGTPAVRIGFGVYQQLYQKSIKTYDDFVRSPYYNACVKYGDYCVSTKVISPEDFGRWLITHKCRIDNWTSDRLYTEYLIDYLPREPVGNALTRAINHSITWSEKNQAVASDWLRYGNLNLLIHAITSGKITGWILYNSNSGQTLLERLNAVLLGQCWPYIDSEIWARTFETNKIDQQYAQDILKQAGW